MMSYVLTGLIGTPLYAGENSIRWGTAWWLCAGAMPAALAGALAAGRASSLLLEVLIGLLTAASGIHALVASSAGDGAHSNAISGPALGFIGAVTGFGSALSGTGEPLILVPILIWQDVPVLTAIGLSQAIQLPIALLATAGNFFSGNLDPTLGVLLTAGLAIGTFVGARIAHAVPRAAVRSAAAMVLAVVGISIAIKVSARLLA